MAARGLGERHQHGGDPPEQDLHPLPHQQEIGVVRDVGARGAEVQERPRRRRLLAQEMDVRHHVVAQALLVLRRAVEIRVVEVGAQLAQGVVGDGEPQLLLALHQGEPQATPQTDAASLAPQRLHRRRGVA